MTIFWIKNLELVVKLYFSAEVLQVFRKKPSLKNTRHQILNPETGQYSLPMLSNSDVKKYKIYDKILIKTSINCLYVYFIEITFKTALLLHN